MSGILRLLKFLAVLWIVLFSVVIFTIFDAGIVSKQESRTSSSRSAQMDSVNKTRTTCKTQSNKTEVVGTAATQHFDILINSYMRSGSSFTGQLLGFRPDTFYWYEPIWKIRGLYYLMGLYACKGPSTCGFYGTHYIETAHKILHRIYTCNFTSLTSAIADDMTPQHSGDQWKPYLSCRAEEREKKFCVKIMEDVCKKAKHRATKLVRLTVDDLENVLQEHQTVKVIHLFRHPRAIINSQLTTDWYNASDSLEYVRTAAKDLCSRFKYDLIKGERLKPIFPDRFTFIAYEDLLNGVKVKSEMLYSYFGIDNDKSEEIFGEMKGILQEEHTVNRTRGSYKDWWRFNLSFRMVKIIDDECDGLLSFLGYKQFSSEAELRNASNTAYEIRKDFLIENIDKTHSYDFNTLLKLKPHKRAIDIYSSQNEIISKLIMQI